MIKHFYNEEKGTVVAVAKDCQDDAIIRIVKRMQGSIHVNDEDLQRLAKMHYSYSAVAKCHPDDKFDRDKGRQIADEKLQKKLAAATDKAVNRWKKHHCGLIKNI